MIMLNVIFTATAAVIYWADVYATYPNPTFSSDCQRFWCMGPSLLKDHAFLQQSRTLPPDFPMQMYSFSRTAEGNYTRRVRSLSPSADYPTMYCNHLDLLAMRRQQGIEPHPGPAATVTPISIFNAVFSDNSDKAAGAEANSTTLDAVSPPSSTCVVMEVLQVSHFSNHLAQITSRKADVFAIGEHSMEEATATSIQSQLQSQYNFSSVFQWARPRD